MHKRVNINCYNNNNLHEYNMFVGHWKDCCSNPVMIVSVILLAVLFRYADSQSGSVPCPANTPTPHNWTRQVGVVTQDCACEASMTQAVCVDRLSQEISPPCPASTASLIPAVTNNTSAPSNTTILSNWTREVGGVIQDCVCYVNMTRAVCMDRLVQGCMRADGTVIPAGRPINRTCTCSDRAHVVCHRNECKTENGVVVKYGESDDRGCLCETMRSGGFAIQCPGCQDAGNVIHVTVEDKYGCTCMVMFEAGYKVYAFVCPRDGCKEIAGDIKAGDLNREGCQCIRESTGDFVFKCTDFVQFRSADHDHSGAVTLGVMKMIALAITARIFA